MFLLMAYNKDQDRYDEWQSGTLQAVQAEALFCRDLLRSDDLRDASGDLYDWMEIWGDDGTRDIITTEHIYTTCLKKERRKAMAKVISNDTEIKIETSQGTLIAKLCDDPNYPGIWLEIDRPEFGNSIAVAKLEVYEDSGRVVLDVYSDALQDEVTEQIPIENLDSLIEEYFTEEEE